MSANPRVPSDGLMYFASMSAMWRRERPADVGRDMLRFRAVGRRNSLTRRAAHRLERELAVHRDELRAEPDDRVDAGAVREHVLQLVRAFRQPRGEQLVQQCLAYRAPSLGHEKEV